jgi:uncharacterized protein
MNVLKVFTVFFVVAFFSLNIVNAQNVMPKPYPSKLVVDAAGVLSPIQISNLNQQLVKINNSNLCQIAIVTIPTLDGYAIEEYANKLFRVWGIGNKKTNNGLLILVSLKEKKIRIEVGYGLESKLTDEISKHIIDNELSPSFKKQQYFEGFNKATLSIANALIGNYGISTP